MKLAVVFASPLPVVLGKVWRGVRDRGDGARRDRKRDDVRGPQRSRGARVVGERHAQAVEAELGGLALRCGDPDEETESQHEFQTDKPEAGGPSYRHG